MFDSLQNLFDQKKNKPTQVTKEDVKGFIQQYLNNHAPVTDAHCTRVDKDTAYIQTTHAADVQLLRMAEHDIIKAVQTESGWDLQHVIVER